MKEDAYPGDGTGMDVREAVASFRTQAGGPGERCPASARLGQSRAACLTVIRGRLARRRVPFVEERVHKAGKDLRLLGEAQVRGILDGFEL